jgi:hypothetical protein
MALLNQANKIYVGGALAAKVYLGTTLVWTPFSAMQFNAIFTALQVVGNR